MAVAVATVVEVELQCPVCSCTHDAPSGRLYWTAEELARNLCCKQVCRQCMETFTMPRLVRVRET